jgi:hypothetical protein
MFLNDNNFGHEKISILVDNIPLMGFYIPTAGNPHKQNSRFCKEIREDNFRFWWRRVTINNIFG